VSQLMLPYVLERVYAEAPNMGVEIENVSTASLNDLREGKIDLGVGLINDVPDFNAAYHQPLFDDRFVCLMRKGHPLANASLDVACFAGASHALLSITGRGKGEIDRRLADIGLSRDISLRLPHFLAIHSIISKTDLITTIPLRLANEFKSEKLIVMDLPKEIDGPAFTIAQIWHERFHQDPARMWLRNIVKEVSKNFV